MAQQVCLHQRVFLCKLGVLDELLAHQGLVVLVCEHLGLKLRVLLDGLAAHGLGSALAAIHHAGLELAHAAGEHVSGFVDSGIHVILGAGHADDRAAHAHSDLADIAFRTVLIMLDAQHHVCGHGRNVKHAQSVANLLLDVFAQRIGDLDLTASYGDVHSGPFSITSACDLCAQEWHAQRRKPLSSSYPMHPLNRFETKGSRKNQLHPTDGILQALRRALCALRLWTAISSTLMNLSLPRSPRPR